MEKDPNGQPDALHVPVGSLSLDLILAGLHVVDDGLFDEGDFEVEALAINLRRQLTR